MSKELTFAALDDLLSKVDERGSIITKNKFSEIDEWIHSGNYLFNAQLSGSLFGGYPNSRSVALAGETGTGKTFLALNACREAQKVGYHIIFCDSEAAISQKEVLKFGIDPEKFRYQPINTPKQFSHFVANLVDTFKQAKKENRKIPKVLLVLDSLGNLATDKSRADALSGSLKKDMTKAQEIKSLFSIVTMDLAEAKIPFILTAHTYACIFGNTEVMMNNGKYKEIKEIQSGEFVMTLEGEKEVTNTFEYDVDSFIEFEFEDGFILKCTDKHKLATLDKDGNLIFKTANELNEQDEIIQT